MKASFQERVFTFIYIGHSPKRKSPKGSELAWLVRNSTGKAGFQERVFTFIYIGRSPKRKSPKGSEMAWLVRN